MSKKKPDFEYERTGAYKFFTWLSGEKDSYVGNVEMKPQRVKKISKETIYERMAERRMRRDKVYDIEDNKIVRGFNRVYFIIAIIFLVIMFLTLVETVSYLPAVGEPDKSVNNEVPTRYIEKGLQETGSVNIVTGMILTYRAFDTFGETNVLFVATICVMIMLLLDEGILKVRESKNRRQFEPNEDPILQGTAKVLVPVIFIFGIYIILNGQISPGGGFSGGAILGAGMILYVSAFGFKKTQRWFNENVYRVAKVTALIMYGCIGLYYYTCGANGINNHIPLGIAGHILSGGIILPIDICVGVEVACTMYAFYALFRRGGL